MRLTLLLYLFLAEKVESAQQYAVCSALGFDLFRDGTAFETVLALEDLDDIRKLTGLV